MAESRLTETCPERRHSALLRPWLLQPGDFCCNRLNCLKLPISGPIEQAAVAQALVIDHISIVPSQLVPLVRARLRWALREDDEEFVLARRALLCSFVVMLVAASCGPGAGVAGVTVRLRVLLFT